MTFKRILKSIWFYVNVNLFRGEFCEIKYGRAPVILSVFKVDCSVGWSGVPVYPYLSLKLWHETTLYRDNLAYHLILLYFHSLSKSRLDAGDEVSNPECRSVSGEEFGSEEVKSAETLEYHGRREQGTNEDVGIVGMNELIKQIGIASNKVANVNTDTDEETESEDDVGSNYVEVPLFWHPLGFKPCQQFSFQFMEDHDSKWPYAKTPIKQEGKKGVSPLGDQKGEDTPPAKTTMQSAAQALLSLAEVLEKDENDLMLVSDNGHRYYPDKRMLQHHKRRKKEYLKKKQAVDHGPNPIVSRDPHASQQFKTISMISSKTIAGNQPNDNLHSTRYMTSMAGDEGRIFSLPRANNTCLEIPTDVHPCLPFKQIHPQVSIGLAGCRHACKLADPWDFRNPFF